MPHKRQPPTPPEAEQPQPNSPRQEIGWELYGCLCCTQTLMICARGRSGPLVSWEEQAEESSNGQRAPEAGEERPWTPIPGLKQRGMQLAALATAHPEAARRWQCLPAWAVVAEVLDLFKKAVEKVGADRCWAMHWAEVRPALASYRYTDGELEAMAEAIRTDLKAGANTPLHVPALPSAAPSAHTFRGTVQLAFEPGAFVYYGHREPLTGKPWHILKALDKNGGALTLETLLETLWKTATGDETVRSAVRDARQALRRAMKAVGVTAPNKKNDPIPKVDRGSRRTAWRLDLP